MEKGELRKQFLTACNKIAEPLIEYGFAASQKGQCLKRKSANKDFTYQVFFESSHYNDAEHIDIRPALTVVSKKAKAYDMAQTGNPHCQGTVWSSNLGILTPQNYHTVWNVAKKTAEENIHDISNLIIQYAIPVFQMFEAPEKAVEIFKVKGTMIYEHMTRTGYDSLMPLTFMLLYGTKHDAEDFVNGYVHRCTYQARIYELYESLPNAKKIDLMFSEFVSANYIKQAYLEGLELRTV